MTCTPHRNIIPMVKSRRIRWVGHVACMGKKTGVYEVMVGENIMERDHLSDVGVHGTIILKRIFKKSYTG